ncbi:MAG: TonB-dependent receptor [Bacteroidetes bacterium]|nr:TonB-dependent receptor [Bacteroidota bacterium]
MKYLLFIVLGFLPFQSLWAQTVHGHVVEELAGGKTVPISGAFVSVFHSTNGVVTDSLGIFVIHEVNPDVDALLVTAFGYQSDTVYLKGNTMMTISLFPLTIDAVEITRRKASRLETTPMNVEVINSLDLVKDACCNLSESFESSASVDVNFTDAVSGAKEIRMLGLDGIYTQILVENIPSIRSLGNTFGLNFIPGPLMSSIQLNKGAGSVVNGYESMTGQINVELKKPRLADKLYVNLYLNQDMRTELNLISATKLSSKWSTLSAVHGQLNWLKMDLNHDGFMDNPLVKNLNLFNRFNYESGKVFGFWSSVTVNLEDRRGGQSAFNPNEGRLTQDNWGLRLKTERVEAFAKTAFNLPKENFIGIQYKYIYHHQFGYIGRRDYTGLEHFGYLNFIYQKNLNEKDDLIKFGASGQIDYVNEVFDTLNRNRTEIVPGIFSEVAFSFGKRKNIVLVGGLRADYHNLYGFFITPRFNMKWNIIPDLSFRVSGGRGYRVPTLFAENFGLLANNREIFIDPNIKVEEAWNYGANLTYKYFLNFREGLISIDYYRTDFIRQVVVDLENARKLQFYNLDGHSFANAMQVELSYEVIKGFDVKLAYKFEQTKTDYQSGRKIIPLRPQHRGLVSLQYKTRKERWRFNTSFNWFGKTRIPDTSPNDVENQRLLQSKDFFQLNAQITFKIKKWEIYLGGENLTNFSQKNPIISSSQPFSNQFDASLIWAPLRGAMAFAGFRFVLN